jgi:hypothetical protein
MALSPTSSRGGGGGGSSVTISETEPASPTDGQLWLRLQDNTQTYQLYCYDAGQSSWIQASAGVTAASYDGQQRQVGSLIGDADDGNFSGLDVNATSTYSKLVWTTADGDVSGTILVGPSFTYLQYGSARFSRDATGWKITGAPTVDPDVDGYLWIDPVTRVLKVSDGP